MRQRLIDARKGKDVLGQRVDVLLRCMPVGKRNQQIEIADSLLASPQRTRGRDRLDALSRFFNVRNDCVCEIVRWIS